MKKLPLCFLLLLLLLPMPSKSYGYGIEYQADYLWTIKQFEFPAKDLRIVLLDTRQGMVKIFSDYTIANNLVVKPYALAGVRISNGKVLKMFFFTDLAQLKNKVVNYCQDNNISFAWRQHLAGQSIKDWWLSKQ